MKELKKVGNAWYLITTRGQSTAVRPLTKDAAPLPASVATEIVSANAPRWNARDLWLPDDPQQHATSIPYHAVEAWQAIASRLDADPGSFNRERPTIPRTALRTLCSWLERTSRSDHPEITRAWAEDPRPLARAFLESVAAFEEYTNDEPFVGPKRSGKSLLPTTKFAREVVRIVRERSFIDIAGTPFRYAGYEISPRRTTGAEIGEEETSNNSGQGGIDLVITDGTGLALVELKASTDKTLFFALVQSLMYAAELASPEQQRRLAKHGLDPDADPRPDLAFLETAATPYLDLVLLFETQSSQAAQVESVARLAEVLLADTSLGSVRPFIRRIYFVAASIQDGQLVCDLKRLVTARK